MSPAEGTAFERFGGAKEVDMIEALLAGYSTDIDTVKEAAFHAFLAAEQSVDINGREIIARLSQEDPWVAAEFTFNLMAESQITRTEAQNSVNRLYPVDCWDLAATSLPERSSKATYELARGFCVLMDNETGFDTTQEQCIRAADIALCNDCSTGTVRLLAQRGIQAIRETDERYVDEDRRAVQNFTEGVGTMLSADPEKAARIQARIDAHISGDHIVNSIKFADDDSRLDHRRFMNLLGITKIVGEVGTEEDKSYLTRMLVGVLGRLSSEEVDLYLAEIIETYLALDEGHQEEVAILLAQKSRDGKTAKFSGLDKAQLVDLTKKCRDERYSYGRPDPEHYRNYMPHEGQLFWPGDVVKVADPSVYRDNTYPKQMEDTQVIDDLVRYMTYPGGGADVELQKYYRTHSAMEAKAHSFELVERGELWKYCHGEITEFTDPNAAREYAVRSVEYRFVRERDTFGIHKSAHFHSEHIDWSRRSVLKAIELGYVDGFKMDTGFMTPGGVIVALKFDDPKIAELIANSTLASFGRHPRKVEA